MGPLHFTWSLQMCSSSKWSEVEPEYCSETFWSLLLMAQSQLGSRVDQPFPTSLQSTFNPKPYELVNFKRMFISFDVLQVVSRVSNITCLFFFYSFFLFLCTKWRIKLVEGLLSMRPTPSSLNSTYCIILTLNSTLLHPSSLQKYLTTPL